MKIHVIDVLGLQFSELSFILRHAMTCIQDQIKVEHHSIVHVTSAGTVVIDSLAPHNHLYTTLLYAVLKARGCCLTCFSGFQSLRWRHNGCDSVSNHQPRECLLRRLITRTSKKTSKLRVTGLCAGNSPETGEFPAQMASNAENVSIWWRHHGFNMPFVYRLPSPQNYQNWSREIRTLVSP